MLLKSYLQLCGFKRLILSDAVSFIDCHITNGCMCVVLSVLCCVCDTLSYVASCESDKTNEELGNTVRRVNISRSDSTSAGRAEHSDNSASAAS